MQNPTNLHLKNLLPQIGLWITIALLAGCASTPDVQPIVKPVAKYKSPIIDYAMTLQGVPYRYGKESPDEGFDCSGFVKHVYGKYGVPLPRTARQMAAVLPPISRYHIQSGDLVFFNTSAMPYSHVGIFIEDDRFIHAPSRRTGRVLVSSLNNRYWSKRFVGARRPRIN